MLGLDAAVNLFKGFAVEIRPGSWLMSVLCFHTFIPELPMPLQERLSLTKKQPEKFIRVALRHAGPRDFQILK
jgi:hypothetical protein